MEGCNFLSPRANTSISSTSVQSPSQLCYLGCQCCRKLMNQEHCWCHKLTKEVSTQTETENTVFGYTKEEYSEAGTAAHTLLKNQIANSVKDFNLASGKGNLKNFERAYNEVMSTIRDLPNTPRTRKMVRRKIQTRIHTQKNYIRKKNARKRRLEDLARNIFQFETSDNESDVEIGEVDQLTSTPERPCHILSANDRLTAVRSSRSNQLSPDRPYCTILGSHFTPKRPCHASLDDQQTPDRPSNIIEKTPIRPYSTTSSPDDQHTPDRPSNIIEKTPIRPYSTTSSPDDQQTPDRPSNIIQKTPIRPYSTTSSLQVSFGIGDVIAVGRSSTQFDIAEVINVEDDMVFISYFKRRGIKILPWNIGGKSYTDCIHKNCIVHNFKTSSKQEIEKLELHAVEKVLKEIYI